MTSVAGSIDQLEFPTEYRNELEFEKLRKLFTLLAALYYFFGLVLVILAVTGLCRTG
jgi:hypothetical protein